MTAYTTALVVDFVTIAIRDGECCVWAALPANHRLLKTGKVRQIRKIKNTLAEYVDALGNLIRLTSDRRVVQHDGVPSIR